MGGRGREIEASREGHRQEVEVKITTDQGRRVVGPNGIEGYVEGHQLVSKKVSFEVEIDCCFIALLVAGIAFAATRIVIDSCTILVFRGDCTRDY